MQNTLERTAFRVQVLAIAEFGILALVFVTCILALPDIRMLTSLLCLIGGVGAGITYQLRRSAFVEPLVYLNILLMLVLLAVVDPLSGTLSGSIWTLYQIWPSLATLVLRRFRSTVIVMAITVTTLVAVATLQITGVIPVELTVGPDILWLNLGIQVMVTIAMASIISVITREQQQSYDTALQLGAAREQQLADNQQLLDKQEALNQELRASLDQVQQRDAQLRDEQAMRQDLLRTVESLAAPVIPISDEIVVAPLVGSFDQARLRALSGDLLDQIARRQARVLILDVTGLNAFDTATAQALLATVDSCRLMGTQTMLVGIQPEVAQTIVGLGIDLEHIATRSTLQEAIQSAMMNTHSSGGRASVE
ncbi:STAS domain-containing protein [Chloroflexales bacterium ZM16-3]|nr:STAS domain-containing protein [Chloroflexales bacterium ZM16-3]